ncbi:MAG TPA: cytochrome c maturation protein CcmE [Hyphomicrobium sp.]|jgi:cytochrome c-type biogenesis protein CcmE
MTRKQKRGVLIGGGVATLGVALILVLFALKDSVVFFHTPSDIIEKGVHAGERIRLGGLVEQGSVVHEGTTIKFKVTDTLKEIPVTYTGVLPDLFREGQGVVTEGVLDGNGGFKADSVLAKHDANYMPPNVAKALEARGVKLGTSAHPGQLKAEAP